MQQLIRDRYNADAGAAAHAQLPRGGAGEVDDSSTAVRAAIIDRHLDLPAIVEICNLGPGSQGQARMSGGERILVKALAAGRSLAVKSRSIPGCFADLLAVHHPGGLGRFRAAGVRSVREAGRQG